MPTTTFTTIPDSTLAQDKPLTQSIARALRDNPLAIAAGDPTAPRVSTLGISSQYMKVSRLAAQGYGGGNVVVVPDNKDFDPDNLFNLATSRFQPTVAGLYLVGAKIFTNNAPASSVVVAINKNGVEIDNNSSYVAAANINRTPQLSTIITMNGTTDYIDFHTYSSVGTYNVIGNFWAVGLCEL